MVQSNTPRLNMRRLLDGGATNVAILRDHFQRLSVLGNLTMKSISVNVQPSSPSEGDVYSLGAGPVGDAWEHYRNHLAYFTGGLWWYIPLSVGLRGYVQDEQVLRIFNGQSWLREGSTQRITVRPEGVGSPLVWLHPLFRTNSICTIHSARFAPFDPSPSRRVTANLIHAPKLDAVSSVTIAQHSDFFATGAILNSAGFANSVVPAQRWVAAALDIPFFNDGDFCLQVTYSEALL